METKKITQSKTIWFNILTIVAMLITEISATPELKEMLGGSFYLLIAGSLVNMGLRMTTTKPIEVKKKKEVKKRTKSNLDILEENYEDQF